MDVKKDEINICIKSVKNNISTDKFNIHKIDIDTKSIYYIIKVLYFYKHGKTQELFLEYLLEKGINNNTLHCFSNNINLDVPNDNRKTVEETYNTHDIIKMFYDKNKWITISEIDNIESKIRNTFNNPNDFYEILNKEFYYTYILKENKLMFLSKGIKNNVNQYYDENIKNIILDNNKFIFIKKILENINIKKKDCQYKIKCINPNCKFIHPENYDLETAYKQYIIEEKNRNPMFKSLNCNFNDDTCPKHKYNKCKFKHQNDLIEENTD